MNITLPPPIDNYLHAPVSLQYIVFCNVIVLLLFPRMSSGVLYQIYKQLGVAHLFRDVTGLHVADTHCDWLKLVSLSPFCRLWDRFGSVAAVYVESCLH